MRTGLRVGKPEPAAPAERAARRVEPVRLAAPLVAGIARHFHHLRHVLAADEVDEEIRLPRAVPDLLVARRDLHHAPQRQRQRVLLELRQEIDLAAHKPVADVIARPDRD